tara:strand:+ start:308 stop:448 length:141 start_codon:yes stop_codon:yes gene_type:complete
LAGKSSLDFYGIIYFVPQNPELNLTPIFALVLTVTKYKNLAVGGAI